ncbi:MAG: helix-turn-helix transcriptional regulator [Bacteroides sp.]|nr:helix-turn-helix transcriptional regulator [Bacteroides sp.]
MSKLNASELINKGAYYTSSQPIKADSALVCYLVATNRLLDTTDTQSIEDLTTTYVNLAFLYSDTYLDYQESYRYLTKAKDLASANRFDKILPYIHLNLAVLLSNCEDLRHTSPSESFIDEFTTNLDSAIKTGTKDDKVMFYSFFNLCDQYFLRDNNTMFSLIEKYNNIISFNSSEFKVLYLLLKNGIENFIKKDFNKAAELFLELSNIYPSYAQSATEVTTQALYYRAMSLSAGGKKNEAHKLLCSLHSSLEKSDCLKTLMWLDKRIADYMISEEGNTSESDKYLLEHYKIKEYLNQSGNPESIKELRFKSQLSDFQEELYNIRVNYKNRQFIFIGCTIVAVGIILLLIIALSSIRKKHRHIMSLYEKNKLFLEAATHPVPEPVTPSDESSYDNPEDSTCTILDEPRRLEMKAKIDDILASDAIYDPDFTMTTLCRMLNTNHRYASYVINRSYGKNFKILLTQMRIAKACRIISDPKEIDRYTIQSLCINVGFRSRTAFSTAFKNITGLSTSEYKHAAKKYEPPTDNLIDAH